MKKTSRRKKPIFFVGNGSVKYFKNGKECIEPVEVKILSSKIASYCAKWNKKVDAALPEIVKNYFKNIFKPDDSNIEFIDFVGKFTNVRI